MKKILYTTLLQALFILPFFLTSQAQNGLISYNVAPSYEGYTLYTNNNNVYLIDNCGKLIQEWNVDNTVSLTAYLLEDGNLLFMSKLNTNNTFQGGGGGGGRLQIYNQNSVVIWQYDFYEPSVYCVHHDVEPLPNGNILAIAWEEVSIPTAIAEGRDPSSLGSRLWAEKIIEIQPIGSNGANIVWEWRLMDHLVQDFDPSKNNYGVVANHPELLDINAGGGGNDWIHFNGIDYNENFDQILLSSRHLSEMYIIDHSTTDAQADGHTGGNYGKGGDFLYRYGNPQNYQRGSAVDQVLFTQHDAQWIPDGYPNAGMITVFNNGNGRPSGSYSTADVINTPVSGNGFYPTLSAGQPYLPSSPLYEFDMSPTGGSFYSGNQGGVSALPNGNLLICNANSAEYFEIDQTGQTVWEYECPFGGSTFKTPRYEPSYPGLQFLNLTPGSTVENPSSPVSNGCTVVYQNCSVSFSGLPTVTSTLSPINLSGSPAGGTFSGLGIIFSAFNPTIAGPGSHDITYTYTDANGCTASYTQSILVFTVIFNFVNYNLGTISPKIIASPGLPDKISVDEKESTYTFEIINIEGKILHQKNVDVKNLMYTHQVEMPVLEKGTYIARFYNQYEQLNNKFVVSE